MRAVIILATLIAVVVHSDASAGKKIEDKHVCKAAISAIMGRDPEIIRIESSTNGITRLSYVRKNDQKKWSYRCKVVDGQILWASETGRWRSSQFDEKISFTLSDNGSAIFIIQKFSDNSTIKDRFDLNRLR